MKKFLTIQVNIEINILKPFFFDSDRPQYEIQIDSSSIEHNLTPKIYIAPSASIELSVKRAASAAKVYNPEAKSLLLKSTNR